MQDDPRIEAEEERAEAETSGTDESEAVAAHVPSHDRAQRFYDRIRHRITSYVESKGKVLGKSAEYLLLVPDVFMLLFRLALDERVSSKNKVLLGTGLAYFIFPIDIMPEALLGPIGFLDDLIFAVYILETMLVDTDEAVLREHWSGKDDVLDMIRNVLKQAESLVSKDVIERIRKMIK